MKGSQKYQSTVPYFFLVKCNLISKKCLFFLENVTFLTKLTFPIKSHFFLQNLTFPEKCTIVTIGQFDVEKYFYFLNDFRSRSTFGFAYKIIMFGFGFQRIRIWIRNTANKGFASKNTLFNTVTYFAVPICMISKAIVSEIICRIWIRIRNY